MITKYSCLYKVVCHDCIVNDYGGAENEVNIADDPQIY